MESQRDGWWARSICLISCLPSAPEMFLAKEPICWITRAYWLREADKVRPAFRVSVLAVIISLLVSVDEVFLETVYLPKLDPPMVKEQEQWTQ
eukprot:scaffold611_cov166-Chaetoceros_neogracile.AAC.2